MNVVTIMGRLTKDVEVKQTEKSAVAKFTVAVNRQFKKEGEERQADFINCVAFSHNANHIAKYFSKGSMIGLIGRIQTGKYDKDGTTVYTTDVIVDSTYFCSGKNEGQGNSTYQGQSSDQYNNVPPAFTPIDDGESELPWA